MEPIKPEGIPVVYPPGGFEYDPATREGSMIGQKCADCGTVQFPPRTYCHECLSSNLTRHVLSKEGVLYSFSILRVGPTELPLPVALGYIDLADGVRVLGQVEASSLDRIRCDQKVQTVTGVIKNTETGPVISYKFRVIEPD